jgi:hypothetical protein
MMDTVSPDWPSISELNFDVSERTLTIVFRTGEITQLHSVSQQGFDRFIGRTNVPADIPSRDGKADVKNSVH